MTCSTVRGFSAASSSTWTKAQDTTLSSSSMSRPSRLHTPLPAKTSHLPQPLHLKMSQPNEQELRVSVAFSTRQLQTVLQLPEACQLLTASTVSTLALPRPEAFDYHRKNNRKTTHLTPPQQTQSNCQKKLPKLSKSWQLAFIKGKYIDSIILNH